MNYLIVFGFALLVLSCATAVAEKPASTGQPNQVAESNDAELWDTIIEQAFIIEALQGEIIALQEGGADYGYVYIVKEGQTLWMIADEVLGDPYQWITIFTMNYWMGDPNLIYPYQALLMP